MTDARLRAGNASRGALLARDVLLLRSRFARLRQAFGRRLEAGQALYLAPAPSVHALGALHPVRILFLDAGDRVLGEAVLRPWRALPSPGGTSAALILRAEGPSPASAGDHIEWLGPQPRLPGRADWLAAAAADGVDDAPAGQAATEPPGSFRPWLASLRPRHWIKNLVVFAGVGFSGHAARLQDLAAAAVLAVLFCLASSAAYLFNDVVDRQRDRLHPRKRHRPITSGRLAPSSALLASALLAAAALAAAAWQGGAAAGALAAYLALQAAYSLGLKHVAILDVLCVAAGFLLRVVGGVWVVRVALSPWLIACSVQLALFLALCKRRAEAVALPGDGAQRPALASYGGRAADLMVAVTAAATLVTYTLYALLPAEPLRKAFPGLESRAGAPGMIWTLPMVFTGVLRYIHLVYRERLGEEPEALLWKDRPLLAAVLLYALAAGVVVYGVPTAGAE